MKQIDINSDMGEGFGIYRVGDDEAMLDIATTANLACGYHAGDPSIMTAMCRLAKTKGVAIGAHPGYPDLLGFGRRNMPFTKAETMEMIAYQIGACDAIAKSVGYRMTHVKTHGAVGHVIANDPEMAEAFVQTVRRINPELRISVMSCTLLEDAVTAAGSPILRELYADRAYLDDGKLMPRSREGSVIHDAEEGARRAVAMLEAGGIITESGKVLPVAADSVCIHGDTPGALAMARAVRARIIEAGWTVRPYTAA
ncbi:5-oxoprolinase subunit PxpA [Robbsia sp. KACC 23696]|uniref:LamB/YcsF family protein n=1 Tax=Robbsia sp. KACC 23696 TaxID=3149231 RepID=UPI00325B020D